MGGGECQVFQPIITARNLGQGKIFTGMYQSFCPPGGGGTPLRTVGWHPVKMAPPRTAASQGWDPRNDSTPQMAASPKDGTPKDGTPKDSTPPRTSYGQQAGGTHPNRMLSCLAKFLPKTA